MSTGHLQKNKFELGSERVLIDINKVRNQKQGPLRSHMPALSFLTIFSLKTIHSKNWEEGVICNIYTRLHIPNM